MLVEAEEVQVDATEMIRERGPVSSIQLDIHFVMSHSKFSHLKLDAH